MKLCFRAKGDEEGYGEFVNDDITVMAVIKNTEENKVDEIVQLYFRDVRSGAKQPLKQLVGFDVIRLTPARPKR